MGKRAQPDTSVKRSVGRPRKKKKTTPASDSGPPQKLKLTLPSATTQKKRQSSSSSASARSSASASASVPISDSEASSNVLVHLDSDSDILDDVPAPDIDAAAAAILGRNDDEEDLFADEAEKSQDSDEETEPQHEEEEVDIGRITICPHRHRHVHRHRIDDAVDLRLNWIVGGLRDCRLVVAVQITVVLQDGPERAEGRRGSVRSVTREGAAERDARESDSENKESGVEVGGRKRASARRQVSGQTSGVRASAQTSGGREQASARTSGGRVSGQTGRRADGQVDEAAERGQGGTRQVGGRHRQPESASREYARGQAIRWGVGGVGGAGKRVGRCVDRQAAASGALGERASEVMEGQWYFIQIMSASFGIDDLGSGDCDFRENFEHEKLVISLLKRRHSTTFYGDPLAAVREAAKHLAVKLESSCICAWEKIAGNHMDTGWCQLANWLIPAEVASWLVPDGSLAEVADEMNIRRKELNIGYKLSTWTKDIMPRVITTPIHLIRLFNAVAEERTVRANARTPAKKPLQVNIVDLREKSSEKPESKKGAAKKPKSEASSFWLYLHASKKADSSDDEGEEARPGKKKTGPQYLRELEAHHKCERHGGHCLVAKNGEHIPLGGPNLSLWSMLCAQGVHNSISTPPAIMGLPFETGSEAAPRSRATSSRQLPPPPAPYPYPYYPPPGPYPHVYQPQPAPPAFPADVVNPPPSVSNADPDSDDDESPTLFPKIDDWLLELDTSDRGEDGHGFHKFGHALRNEGFARLVQILDLGAEGEKELMKICDGMSIGVAKLMMKYAKADCKKIRKREAERKAMWRCE
ncbi:hypothetical protein GGX14DRAFT_646425 [Mycena pura]|uniref:Uncharacterized protein n=1 Tax=Mycena pura TaxID=153505 RepID=A0AAD6YC04_9AGAR|nr:hypothetical protein GGX14DRAFT_646425 [Mycena pura]